MSNTRPALAKLLADFPRATVAMEAGTHSPWISRFLTELGAKVIVANPRKLHAISRNERKCDQRDAQMLARLARVDPALLHPIEHGSAQAQHDLLGLKLRDALVRTRVNLINAIRFTLKSLGHSVRNPSSESFHKTVLADIPADCLPVIQPLLAVLVQVTEQIKGMERDLVQRSKKEYPATQRLQQIAGVGPLTALCFVLKIALFMATVDADATALIRDATDRARPGPATRLPIRLVSELFDGVDQHPLAKRVLSGQEPDALVDMLDLPVISYGTDLLIKELLSAQRGATCAPTWTARPSHRGWKGWCWPYCWPPCRSGGSAQPVVKPAWWPPSTPCSNPPRSARSGGAERSRAADDSQMAKPPAGKIADRRPSQPG